MDRVCFPPSCDVGQPVRLSPVFALPEWIQWCVCHFCPCHAQFQVVEINNGLHFTCEKQQWWCKGGICHQNTRERPNFSTVSVKTKRQSHENCAYSVQDKDMIVAVMESGAHTLSSQTPHSSSSQYVQTTPKYFSSPIPPLHNSLHLLDRVPIPHFSYTLSLLRLSHLVTPHAPLR